jgi:hypothetical protein
MEDFEDTISQFLYGRKDQYAVRHRSIYSGFLTCSGDVLIKTGGPFKQLMKIGTSFFKNAGYMGPVT